MANKTVYPSLPCSIAPVYTDNDCELPSLLSKQLRIEDEIESSGSCEHFSDDYVYKSDDPVKLKSSDFNKLAKELILGKRSSHFEVFTSVTNTCWIYFTMNQNFVIAIILLG